MSSSAYAGRAAGASSKSAVQSPVSIRIAASVSMFQLARRLRWVTGGSRKCDPGSRRTDTVSIAMTQRFVVLDDWTDFWGSQPALDRLRQRGEVTIHTTPAAHEEDGMRRAKNPQRGV